MTQDTSWCSIFAMSFPGIAPILLVYSIVQRVLCSTPRWSQPCRGSMLRLNATEIVPDLLRMRQSDDRHMRERLRTKASSIIEIATYLRDRYVSCLFVCLFMCLCVFVCLFVCLFVSTLRQYLVIKQLHTYKQVVLVYVNSKEINLNYVTI